MKPGPATSTAATRSSARNFSAILSARSRGFALASLASTIAALVAMSPWLGIARRLDHDAGEIDAGGPLALGRERGADRLHARQHVGKQVL
jgi:hypothetical protein